MEKIQELAQQLNNIPASINRRISEGKILREKLVNAQKANETDPNEETQENLQEILDFISDHEEDLIEDLQVLIDAQTRAKKQALEQEELEAKKKEKKVQILKEEAEKAKQQQNQEKEAQDKLIAKQQEKEKEKQQQDAEEAKKQNTTKAKKEEKGSGAWGLVLGGALLLISLGAINKFQK